ncbi:MAG: hypothetical protein M0008_04470 [Actinomycetota bacterium]|jgi:hypothetical protein|nr:hypothetical protein [Actinomycetota bacterium]
MSTQSLRPQAGWRFNAAVFWRLGVTDVRLCHERNRSPFDDIFRAPEFEYETRVEKTMPY